MRGIRQAISKATDSSPCPIASRIEAELQNAVALHQRGQWADAEQLYRKIMRLAPDHFDAHHLLGVLKHQQGRNAEALDLISTALRREPTDAVALSNQGAVLNALRRFDGALASCDGAIALKPDYAEAFNNRGNALKELERLDEALASYDRAIALRPNYPEAFNNRGNVLKELGRLDEALASYAQATEAVGRNGDGMPQSLNRSAQALDLPLIDSVGFVRPKWDSGPRRLSAPAATVPARTNVPASNRPTI